MPLAFLATWAHCWLIFRRLSTNTPRSFSAGPSLLAAFQPLFPKPVALHGVAVTQVQDPTLSLVEPHTVDLSPSIQPVQVPLQSLPTLKQINTPTQLGVICKLTEGALDAFVQIIDKDIKQDWSQHRALGNTTCDRPPTGVNSIHHHSLGPAVQPVLHPAKSTPIQAMSSQFLQENAVEKIRLERERRSWKRVDALTAMLVDAQGLAGYARDWLTLSDRNEFGDVRRAKADEVFLVLQIHYRITEMFKKDFKVQSMGWDMEYFQSFSPGLCTIVKAEAPPDFSHRSLPRS
ncbi:hypothetical protein QYF61_020004 [Mycteria americana]|uniref:Uncharacterized protein n=1 Tax=Mycteria americana TaxID=33587 RepID=A0AAN7NKV7_MYCAM|nr:hypothetical protein QYF61_020004 [Mycteria americana]